MSAIAGIYHLNGELVEHEHLNNMIDALAHRGVDNRGIWLESVVGFGHRMLWTTPESLSETLPFANETQELVITADARIDNRQELISLLNLEGICAEKITDSQLILASYEKWGDDCPDKLLGDFSFAIWDKPRQIVFCARDHFGIKPFYYYHSQDVFVFASEIKGLFCIPKVPRQLNEVRVGDFLSSTLFDKEITFYKNIVRLPPAHKMKIGRETKEIISYWSLNPEYELKLSSDQEYADKFREIFTEAVSCRLRSAYPVGSMLSGGLDSSSIACMARKILTTEKKQNLNTFSSVFPEVPKSDESFFIDTVVSQGGVQPYYFYGDKASPLVDIEKSLWHQDEPIFACNLYINWKTYEQANQSGVRIVLDGFDGDNTVSHGFGYLKELAAAKRWLKLIVEIKGYTKHFGYSFWQKLWSYINYYGFQPTIHRYKVLRFIWYRYKNLEQKWQKQFASKNRVFSWLSIFNREFADKINMRERRRNLQKKRYGSTTNQRQEHFHDINSGLLPTTLEVLDRTAAAFSVEVRYPLWDKRLVEFCLSLPTEQKMQNGWTRMIMRRAMEGILPKEIQWRGGKGNLGHSFEHGLKTFEREKIAKMLKNSDLIEHYISMSYLNKTCKDFLSKSTEEDDTVAIWKAINLDLWLKNTNMISSK